MQGRVNFRFPWPRSTPLAPLAKMAPATTLSRKSSGKYAAEQIPPVKLGDRGKMRMSPGPTRILILGGGFGGVYTALTLEQLLRHDLRRGAVELTLVNRENYMVFQPMLPEVISGSIGLVDTIAPIRRLCPNTNLYTRPIEKVDIQRRRVLTAAGLGTRPCEIEYDHLVIALGNVTSLADLPGLAEHARSRSNTWGMRSPCATVSSTPWRRRTSSPILRCVAPS